MIDNFPRTPILVAVVSLLLPGRAAAQPEKDAEALFARKLLPLLQAKCFTCHGDNPKDIRGGLDMKTRAGLLQGGESEEPGFIPGQPDKSLLLSAVAWRDLKMPPKAQDRFTPEQVGWVRAWIQAGAPWPDAPRLAALRKEDDWSAADGILVKTSGGLSEEWDRRRYRPEDLWAFQPLKQVAVPWKHLGGDETRNPIDAFLRQKLDEAGLRPAPPADRRVWLRRLTFDLTGLPPTPAEIDAFLRDDAPDAPRRVIDRLLTSPHHAEQTARHWLDVVRYADTAGFSNDWERPQAWRYRDYVVRSFARDQPFDRFLLEQIAGDELDPADPEMALAVGFLRMGPWEHTGMSVAALTRQQWLDDVTNAVGETFLGLPLSCCRCHDHKFDPLPTRDYYRLQAVFAPTQFAHRNAPFLPAENLQGLEEERARSERRLKNARQDIEPVYPPDASDKARQDVDKAVGKVRKKREDILTRELQRYKPLALSVYNGPLLVRNANQPYHPLPKNLQGKLPEVHILQGGALDAPGPLVGPGVVSVASLGDVAFPAAATGRRLALAKWLADPKNPLTARVIVNRVWQQHFGTGLVATPNNFGKMGKRPSHPELLDWLAGWFIEQGWSLRKLHRLIVSSEAYAARSGAADAAAAKIDPDNRLLARFPTRRLAAEEIRDAMLAVSGELNRAVGGLPVRPDIHREVAFQPRHVMGSVAPAYQPSRTPAERHRRTLYAFKVRTLRDPFLEVFDQPAPDLSCERRNQSTIAPQAFALFNSRDSQARALAFALRLEKEAKTPAARIDRAFRLAFGRAPGAAEVAVCRKHLVAMTDHHRGRKLVPEPLPRVIERAFVEEQIGIPFRFREKLDVYADYVPDAQPWDVGPETRALADLCLVLFNANEFLTID